MVEDENSYPLIFEDIPPEDGRYDELLPDRLENLAYLLEEAEPDAINIPEIHPEEIGDSATPRADPRKYGQDLQNELGIQPLINHVVVHHEDEEDFEDWLEETFSSDLYQLILVGGASSEEQYPGPSVPQANQIAHTHSQNGLALGGITIPSRRRDYLDEPERILQKVQNGAEFVTSQLIYDPEPTKQLLKDLDQLFKETDQTPPRYYVSFAPLDCQTDLNFLKHSLRVNVPDYIEEQLLGTNGQKPEDRHAPEELRKEVAERALDHIEQTWNDIADYVEQEDIDIPLGIQISYVKYHNFEYAVELAERLLNRK